MDQSPDIETISLEKHGIFLKNLKMGWSPDIETISLNSMEISRNFKIGTSPDIKTIFF